MNNNQTEPKNEPKDAKEGMTGLFVPNTAWNILKKNLEDFFVYYGQLTRTEARMTVKKQIDNIKPLCRETEVF